MKRILSALLVLCMVVALFAGCTPTEPAGTTAPNETTAPVETTAPIETTAPVEQLVYAEGTELRMACGYQKPEHAISFSADKAGDGVTLANGKTYHTGDLKPTWEEMEKRLGVKFVDKFTGAGSAQKEFEYWVQQLDQVDMVAGTATQLSEYGASGAVVNLAEHLDKMPNLKAYLDANPIIRLSITADVATGAFYFSPYFDGVDDIERMPLMRVDWVEKLLNGAGEFTAEASNKLAAAVYEPYMPTSGKVAVDVVKLDGSAVEQINKDYDAAGNIVATMNAALAAGEVDGVAAVNMLRTYIDKAYAGYYGENRANLFVGQNAAWDADELVALLRCVVANPQTLNGTDNVEGIFSREDANNQRRVDMFRFVGTLFGVRGLESRQDYLYVGNDGKLHDARQEEATYVAIEKMNDMVQEGLISESFVNMQDEKTATMLSNDLGFMHYDYNQTQTILNETQLNGAGADATDSGEKYMAVMVPVARWNDGTGEAYFRFTESWRSVKTDGWAISVAGVGNDENKLNAALALIDYAYTDAGMILLSYGPDEFIKLNADGSHVTFNFNGTEMPVISDATYQELWDKADGNYTNYARYYLGSTLSFVKLQAFEYQCTHDVGKEGAGYISTAIGLGTIKHPALAIADNQWYTSVPTVLPNTTVESQQIASLSDLSTRFNSAKGGTNIFIEQIVGGYTEQGMGSAAETAAYVANTMGGSQYLMLKNDAWVRLQQYYATLNG